MHRILGNTAALIFMLLGTGGCCTVATWNWAHDSQIEVRQVTGIVTEKDGSARSLVVAYGTADNESTFLVPIDRQGKPLPPYAYSGRTSALTSEVTDEQEKVMNRMVQIHHGTVVPTVRTDQNTLSRADFWTSEKWLIAIGYTIDSRNNVRLMSIADAIADPANCRVLVVPRYEQQFDNQRVVVAVLATPFLLAVDAVILPIALPFAIAFVALGGKFY